MVERRGLVKLFGATIQVVAEGDALHVGEEQQKEHLVEESMTDTRGRDQESPECRSGSDPLPSSMERESKELAPADEGSETVKTEEKQGGKGDVPLKKPDKILPCPRCMSMDTKFCYYNNYNVNQPRHFCKKCQRYWTDGGTMRDMPVGAGRRKSKNFASYYRHVHVLDITTQRDQPGIPELVHPSALKPDEVILSFGNDHKKDDAEVSSRSSETGLTCTEERGWTALQEAELQNCQAYTRQVPCVSVPLLPCPWNPSPALFASSIPVSLVSANSSWSSAISGASNFPWLPYMSCPPPSTMQSESGHVPLLRKHPRDENTHSLKDPEDCYDMEESSQKRSLWIPKALRIDDPDEAVKSSLWTTMGIKNSLADGISSRGPFEALQPKTETMNQRAATSHVLHANPVALLRSLRFQESI